MINCCREVHFKPCNELEGLGGRYLFYLMGNAIQAIYGIRKVLGEMQFKLHNDQYLKEILSNHELTIDLLKIYKGNAFLVSKEIHSTYNVTF